MGRMSKRARPTRCRLFFCQKLQKHLLLRRVLYEALHQLFVRFAWTGLVVSTHGAVLLASFTDNMHSKKNAQGSAHAWSLWGQTEQY